MSGTKENKKVLEPYIVRDPLEVLRAVPQSYPCVVDGLLIETGLTMVCGKPKTGKSTFLRQLSVCVAEGTPFLGMPVKCGNVLYASLEGPDAVVVRHFEKLGLTQSHGKLHLMSGSMLNVGEDRFRRLVKTIEGLPGLRLVVLDPVHRLLRPQDNDNYAEITRLMEKLEVIAKHFKLQIVFSTHGKKRKTDDPGDAAVGSVAYRGSTDTNIFLSKQGSQRTIETEQRCLTYMEPTLLHFDEGRQEVRLGPTVESAEDSKRENRERLTIERMEGEIVKALADGSSLTTDELLAAITGNDAKKYVAIERMIQSARIYREHEGKKISYRLAAIAEEAA